MSTAGTTPRVVVCFDVGAADPHAVVAALGETTRLVVLVASSAAGLAALPLFRALGVTVRVDDEPASTERFLRRLRPDAIVTFSERMLGRASELVGLLALPGHSPDTVAALTHKTVQRHLLAGAGLPVPANTSWRPGDGPAALGAVGTPAVVKPVRGEGSRDTLLLTGPADLVAACALPPADYVVEALLVGAPDHRFGDYVSVECATVDGLVTPLAVTGKFALAHPFRETGQFWPALLSEDRRAEVLDATVAAHRALGVRTGITHTELKLCAEGPRIIETNGRLGGNLVGLGRRHGVDLIRLAVDVARHDHDAVARAAGRLADVGAGRGPVDFQLMTPAPRRACRLVECEGREATRALPGVDRLQPVARPGDQLSGGTVTNPLDIVHGVAADHDQLAELCDAIGRELHYCFATPDDRPFSLTAAELHAALDPELISHHG